MTSGFDQGGGAESRIGAGLKAAPRRISSPTPPIRGISGSTRRSSASRRGEAAPTGGQIRIQADVANNSLVIYANLEMREQILKALERIDVPQLQVAINVTMAEIRLTDELRYGIQYFLKSKTFGLGNDNGLLTLFSRHCGTRSGKSRLASTSSSAAPPAPT